jgi:hypothetical protein
VLLFFTHTKKEQHLTLNIIQKNLIPEYVEIMGDNCVKSEVRKGLSTPGMPNPNFVCCANVWIKNPEKFGAAMADQRMKDLMAKISSFTEIQPIRQFEMVISQQ